MLLSFRSVGQPTWDGEIATGKPYLAGHAAVISERWATDMGWGDSDRQAVPGRRGALSASTPQNAISAGPAGAPCPPAPPRRPVRQHPPERHLRRPRRCALSAGAAEAPCPPAPQAGGAPGHHHRTSDDRKRGEAGRSPPQAGGAPGHHHRTSDDRKRGEAGRSPPQAGGAPLPRCRLVRRSVKASVRFWCCSAASSDCRDVGWYADQSKHRYGFGAARQQVRTAAM